MADQIGEFSMAPDPDDPALTRRMDGLDQNGRPIEARVVVERPLTLFLNDREIVTMMTIGDHPDYLAIGYLCNQRMLSESDVIEAVEVDWDRSRVTVQTERQTDYEWKLRKRTLTSGCAQGTVFGDVMENFAAVGLAEDRRIHTSWLYALSRKINQRPSLYLAAGAIHGCVLCRGDQPLIYLEDVGRHNAIDKIAGYMFRHGLAADDKIFYTTGRLTSEMVIKCVGMGIPILVSRSGFTAWGVELAREAGLTLIGRAKGKRFVCLSAPERLVYDADPSVVPTEERRHQRKAALVDDGD